MNKTITKKTIQDRALTPPKRKPYTNITIKLTEHLETHPEALMDAIVAAFHKRNVGPVKRGEFIQAYYSARDHGREALMVMFGQWVKLQRTHDPNEGGADEG